MLSLTRRVGESVLIGDDIEVVIVQMKSGQVRLGIKAPRDVPVLRNELRRLSKNSPGEALPNTA